jgi:O-antigen/teichoic acid export membrane protein
LLVASFHVILGQTDLLLLGVLRESADVGTYNIALKTGAIITFLLTSINAIAGPRIAKMYRSGEDEQLQRMVTFVVHLSFWPSLLGGFVLMGISEPFLSLFGSEFTAAKWAMIIVIIGKLFSVGAGSVGYLANMTGNQDASAWVLGGSAAINVVLNLVLIPQFGIEGAAVSTALTTALQNLWLCWIVRRELGIVSHVFRKLPL